jgi:hypothetical protein
MEGWGLCCVSLLYKKKRRKKKAAAETVSVGWTEYLGKDAFYHMH